jgi:hypothetical protein
MANNKAVRQTINFPPMLNLSNDRPHVDDGFRNFEKLNSPLLNDMLQPVWLRDEGKKKVYDYKGKDYWIEGNKLVSSKEGGLYDVVIDNISGSKFERTERADLKNVLAYDINDTTEAKLTRTGTAGNFVFEFNNNSATITNDHSILTECRVKILNNKAVFVLCEKINDTQLMCTYVMDSAGALTLNMAMPLNWYTQTLDKTLVRINPKDASPCINMCYANDKYFISVTTQSGTITSCNDMGAVTVAFSDATIPIRQFWFVSGGGDPGSTFTENWYGLTFIGTRVTLDWTAGGSSSYSTSDQLSLSYGKSGNTQSKIRQWIHANGYAKFVYSPTATSTSQLAAVIDLPDELEISRNLIGNQSLNITPQTSTNTNLITVTLYSYTGDAYPKAYPNGTRFYNDGTNWRVYVSQTNPLNTIITDANMINEFTGHSYAIGSVTLNNTSQTAGNAAIVGFSVYQVTEYTDTYNFTIRGSTNNMYKAVRLRVKIQNCNSYMYTYGVKGVNGTKVTGVSLSGTDGYFDLDSTADTDGYVRLSVSVTYYTGQNVPRVKPTADSLYLECYNSDKSVTYYSQWLDSSYWNSTTPYRVTYNKAYTNAGGIVVPNVVLDDGSAHPIWKFNVYTGTNPNNAAEWPDAYKRFGYIYHSGSSPNISGATFTTSKGAAVNLGSFDNCVMRSSSFIINQNFYAVTAKTSNTNANTPNALSNGTTEASGSTFIEWTYTSHSGLRYFPGTSRLQSLYNYYSQAAYGDPTLGGHAEDAIIYTVGGYRVPLPGSKFNILYNVENSGYAYTQGISYSDTANRIGTLLTPWQTNDEFSYIAAYGDKVVYKDKSGRWYEIEIKLGTDVLTILEDRLIILNTTSYANCIDSENGKTYHYATDYNGRLLHGESALSGPYSGVLKTAASQYSPYLYSRVTGNGINPLYKVMPRDIITSMLLPQVTRIRCRVGNEITVNSLVLNDNSLTTQGVDVFYSMEGDTTCRYRYTVNPFTANTKFTKHQLLDLKYPGTASSAATLSPSLFASYINGAGNNDMILENYDAYVLNYFDNKPTLNYAAGTQVSNLYDNKSAFFCLQGQFYGVIGDKLYALTYSGGSISSMEAIVDLGDLEFMGNNPMIAFFWDPATKVIRSFTGDANLETIFQASKLKRFNRYWYDETTQSIWISSDAGLLVFGPRNNFMFDDWKNVENVQFSNDGITHITVDDKTINLKYYEDENYIVKPLELETSFFGLGSEELTAIDRWDIVLYDMEGNHPKSYIKVGTRTLNDISVKSEEKELRITPDMYDKWSNSVLIQFSPKLIKGKGIRLYCETPLSIQSITPHFSDVGAATTARRAI